MTDENSGISNPLFPFEYFLNASAIVYNRKFSFKFISTLSQFKLVFFLNIFENKILEIIDYGKLKSCEDIFSKFSLTEIDSSYYFEPFVISNGFKDDPNNILFMFPPGGGGAESYFNNIGTYLTSKKLILFNNIVNNILNLKLNEILCKLTIEKLAFFYIGFIKQIKPCGPYNFFGWSFGGILALEIARILKEKYNDKVSNIFLIDSCIFLKGRSSSPIYNTLELKDIITFEQNLLDIDANIALFKATKEPINRTEFREFVKSYANNLDKIIDINKIKIFMMENDDHDSWVANKDQILKICDYIIKTF